MSTMSDNSIVTMKQANLNKVNFSQADLGEADLREADLRLADLRGANLYKANLSGAIVATEQLDQAQSLTGAIMPDGSKHP